MIFSNALQVKFRTERLVFTALEQKDKSFYLSLYTNDKTMQLIAPSFSQQQAEGAFNATLKAMNKAIKTGNAKTMTWLVSDKNTQQPLGLMSLNWKTYELTCYKTNKTQFTPNEEPEIGMMLTRLAHGKGIAYEAGGGLLEFGLDNLKLNKIHTFFNPKNIAVQRFISKLEMVCSGFIEVIGGQQHWYVNQDWLTKKHFIID